MEATTSLRSALGLGAVSGLRTTGAWAGLAARGRIADSRLRRGLLLAAAGEALADKAPRVPPRGDPPALAGRMASGALAGRLVAGARGAGAGAAGALAATYLSERARALVVARTPLPDPAYGALEDAMTLAAAGALAGRSRNGAAPARAPAEGTSRVAAAARGLLAAAGGTGAMTAAQTALQRVTGAEPSTTPADAGRKLLRATAGRDVPRRRRPAFNQAMHVAYGTAWGPPLGLAIGSGALARRPLALGLGLGVAVWGASLVELPLLGVAPAPWREPPGALLSDLGMHLVYGTATAAIYGALVA